MKRIIFYFSDTHGQDNATQITWPRELKIKNIEVARLPLPSCDNNYEDSCRANYLTLAICRYFLQHRDEILSGVSADNRKKMVDWIDENRDLVSLYKKSLLAETLAENLEEVLLLSNKVLIPLIVIEMSPHNDCLGDCANIDWCFDLHFPGFLNIFQVFLFSSKNRDEVMQKMMHLLKNSPALPQIKIINWLAFNREISRVLDLFCYPTQNPK